MKRTVRYLAVLVAFLPRLLAADSAMFRADAAHTGIYQAAGVPKFSKVKWKFKTGGGVYSSPAIVDGTLYVGSNDRFLYALNVGNGSLKWKVETVSRITSSPAVANGVVYFSNYGGRFYAVEAQSGKLKWKFETGGERRYTATHLHGSLPAAESMPDPFDFYLSSPTVWEGKVYFGSGDGNVYALDADTGKLVWKFKTGDVVHASPAIADGTLFIGSWTATSMRSTQRPGRRSGASKRAKIPTRTTRSAFNRRRWSPTASCTSAAAIPSCTPSTPGAGSRSGCSTTRAHG